MLLFSQQQQILYTKLLCKFLKNRINFVLMGREVRCNCLLCGQQLTASLNNVNFVRFSTKKKKKKLQKIFILIDVLLLLLCYSPTFEFDNNLPSKVYCSGIKAVINLVFLEFLCYQR